MAPAVRFDAPEALLAAGRAELVEHGRAAISLRAVARRAGLSHASPNTTSGTGLGCSPRSPQKGFMR